MIGALWVALMIAAELLLSRYAYWCPWSRKTENFDPTQSVLLGLGPLVPCCGQTAADGSR
jgi:hypothetical protein